MRPLLIAIALTMAADGVAQTPLPDFSLPDVNTNSVRRRATSAAVSPRNYLHQVTLWFFGWETCVHCRNDFLVLTEIYNELNGTTVLPVEIIGVNQVEGGNYPFMFFGKPLSWIRDNETSVSGQPNPRSVEQAWGARHRDAIIVDPLNAKITVYNLYDHDLLTGDNKAALKAMLLAAATPEDTDNDKLPDYWERWAFGNLSGDGTTTGSDGYRRLLHYAHCSTAPANGFIPGLPRIVSIWNGNATSVSVLWTRRRGKAFGLAVTPEFSQLLNSWTTTGHGFADWSSRALYDGSCGEIIEWRTALPNPFRYVRLQVSQP